MYVVPRLCSIIFVALQVAAQLEKEIIREDVGDENWSNVLTYLDYEEPEFDFAKAFTSHEFTDKYEGFMTEQNRARSYGWDSVDWGEVSFAALLVGESKTRYCMGVLVTTEDVITPCSCVRSYWFNKTNTKDRTYKSKEPYYVHDLGVENIYVVANAIEYDETILNQYSKVSGIRSTKMCDHVHKDTQGWNDEISVMLYNSAIAILKMFPAVVTSAASWWPPDPINYDSGPRSEHGAYYVYGFQKYTKEPVVSIVSYFYQPGDEEKEKGTDNFNKRPYKVPNRLIELRARLCDQNYCNQSEGFINGNWKLRHRNQLQYMHCYCDRHYIGDELPTVFWVDEATPHYSKTLYDGLIGAPVLSRGSWIGWIVHPLSHTSRHDPYITNHGDNNARLRRRGTMARAVDKEIIEFINSEIKEISSYYVPHLGDKNRPKFVLRDHRLFLPDPDLKLNEVDLEYWNRIGYRPPRMDEAWGLSRSSPVSLKRGIVFGILLLKPVF